MWVPRVVVAVLVATALVASFAGAAAEGFSAAGEVVARGDGRSSGPTPLVLALGGTLVGAGWAAAGALLTWLRQSNAVGWVLLVVGTLTQLSLSEEAVAAAGWLGPGPAAGDWTTRPFGLALTLVVGWAVMTMLGALPAIYPEGRLPSRTPAWPVILVGAGALLIQLHWVATQPSLVGLLATEALNPWPPAGLWGTVALAVFLIGSGTIWVLAAGRLLRSASPRREQLGWLLGSVVLIIVANLMGESLAAQVIQIGSLYLLPLAICVALLRYRLLGVDATPGADPLRAVAEIGSHVSTSEDGALLPSVLATVRRSVGSPGARLSDPAGRVIAVSGDLASSGFTTYLAVAGLPVGLLEVEARWPGDGFSAREERTLRALATQLAAIIRSEALAEQLEVQRDSVMCARTVERERLRRELHDGLGPALTGIGLGLSGLGDAIGTGDIPRAHEITGVLRDEVAGAVSEVRRILDDLHPGALQTMGLVEAVRRHVATTASTLPVEVVVGRVPPLPAKVEQATYRVVAEAVANATRHADATRLQVRVDLDDQGRLVAQVVDDGRGFDPGNPPQRGIGLASMHRRAEELGGRLTVDSSGSGTTVRLVVPAGVPVG